MKPIFFAVMMMGAGLCAGEETKPATGYTVPGTEERVVRSKAGEDYRILISRPEGEAPEGGFPVMYVLDGDENFLVITGILRRLAGTRKAARQNGIEPGIVVGIGYPGESRRDFDYTPQAPAGPPETYRDGRPYPPRPSGGADAFFGFLEHELKPAIEKDFPVDRGRQALYGNGFGGLFVLHVLFTHPEAFQGYVASSPSVWWNNRYILQEEKAFSARVKKEGAVAARLLITVGEFEQSLTPLEAKWEENEREEHALKIGRRKMVDNTREMAWRLQSLEAASGLSVTHRVFAGEGHASVAPMAVGPALSFAFPVR